MDGGEETLIVQTYQLDGVNLASESELGALGEAMAAGVGT